MKREHTLNVLCILYFSFVAEWIIGVTVEAPRIYYLMLVGLQTVCLGAIFWVRYQMAIDESNELFSRLDAAIEKLKEKNKQ